MSIESFAIISSAELEHVTGGVAKQLPRLAQQDALVGGEGQLARFGRVEQAAEHRGILRSREEGVVQAAAPVRNLLLHAGTGIGVHSCDVVAVHTASM